MDYPVFLSSFVGRKLELEEITSLLRKKAVRLLTLTGPGGSGKTRLAFETLQKLSDEFEDGAVWVDLSGSFLPEAVPQTVAAQLEVKPGPGQPLLAALQAALRSRETLIILDNCEHLVSSCATLANALLRACPSLYLLATSRQTLGVEGEQVWPVPPLSYPAEDSAPAHLILQSDAIRLFGERARQADSRFEIIERDAPALARICKLVEGLPLAIELSAARVNMLELPEIANRLESQLSFLTSTQQTNLTRHQSMRKTILWSYELLSESEKVLFRRLGVFAGGFYLRAVEAICSDPPLSSVQILDLMGKLIDKSLLVRQNAGVGNSRFRQLESIREFAVEQLQEASEEHQTRERHFRFYADLVKGGESHLVGADQRTWTEILEYEYDNLRAALAWAFRESTRNARFVDQSVGIANGLFWFWNYSERYEEGVRWYTQALELPGLATVSPAVADLRHHKATFVWLLGDYSAAVSLLLDSLATAQRAQYSFGIAHAQLLLGILNLHQGQNDRAIHLLQASETLLLELKDPRGLGIARVNLGGAHLEMGNLDHARAYAQQAVNIARGNKDLWTLGLSLSGLGDVLYRQGELPAALKAMEQALEVIVQSGQQWLEAEAILRLAKMLQHQGDLDGAETWLERGYEVAREAGAIEWQLTALEKRGFIFLRRSRHREAAGCFAEILQTTTGETYPNVVAHTFVGVAQLAAREGEWDSAVLLWKHYQIMRETGQLPSCDEEKSTHAILESHPASAVASANGRSDRTLSLTDAASLALEISKSVEARIAPVTFEYELQLLALGSVRVNLLGQLLVPSDWTFAKPQELLFYLASNPPRTKEQIGLDFWPDASPSQLRVSLRAALYHLRRALGRRDWVLYEDGHYRFNRSLNYWYDVEVFERGLQSLGAENEAAAAIRKLESLVSLYRGDFLADIANDAWAAPRREELKQKYVEAMSTLGRLLLDSKAYDRAIQVFANLVSEDNLLEHAHRGLIRAYALQGERVLALRQYQTVVATLRDELGVSPSPETTELYQSLLRGTA